jgi:hypothetical protein
MPLNEVGDFLAGAFGPVAFLWLVLGFLMQSEELRMQAIELRASATQQKALAKAADEQAKAQREVIERERIRRAKEIKVKFSMRTGDSGSGRKSGEVRNEIVVRCGGYHAYNVVLTLDDPFIHCRNIKLGDMKQHTEQIRILNLMGTTSEPRGGNAHLTYEDADGNPGAMDIPFIVTSGRAEFVKS